MLRERVATLGAVMVVWTLRLAQDVVDGKELGFDLDEWYKRSHGPWSWGFVCLKNLFQ